MRNILFALTWILFTSAAYSQSNYIEFKDGNVINFGDEPITEKNPMFKKSSLKVGGGSYDVETIKGYMYNGTYYAQNFGGFFTRVVQGKISFYRNIEYVTDGRGKVRKIITAYLQKGENQKWTKYSNNTLIRMVSDKKKAKDMAVSYKRSMRISNLILISGGLGLFSGAMMIIASQTSSNKSSNLLVPGIALGGVGLGAVVISYVRKFKDDDVIPKILAVYNK